MITLSSVRRGGRRRLALLAGAALAIGVVTPALAVPAASAAAPTLSVSSGAVLDLGFDGDLTDATGAHSVSMQAGTASYVDGIDGQALDLAGNSALNLGTSADLQPQDLTLSFWMKPDADMGSGEQVIAWEKGSLYTSDGWYLTSASSSMPLALSVGPSVTNGQPYLVAVSGTRSSFFPTGQWTHVVVTYDHTDHAVTFYRNGVRQTSVVKQPITATSTGVLGSESTSTKTIGYNGPNYHGAYLKGALDDYRMYNGVASISDVVKLTQEDDPSFDPTTVASSDLDALSLPATTTDDLTLPDTGATGSTITWSSSDTSVIANDGTVTPPSGSDATVTLTASAVYGSGDPVTKTFTVTVPGTPPTTTPEPSLSISSGEALDLEFEGNLTDGTGKHSVSMQTGSASYVDGVDGKALDLTGSSAVDLGTDADLQPQDLTLSFWLKPDSDMGSGEQLISWEKGPVYTDDGWYLSSLNSTTPLELSVGPAADNGQPYLVGVTGSRSSFFPTGQWTHIVVTYNHATQAVKFYRNGVRQDSTVIRAVSATSTGVLGSESTSTKTIGYNGPGYQGAFLKGALDDYRLYNGVASISDVVKLTQEDDPSFDPTTVASSDLDALSLPATTTDDLTLPDTGASGSAITWSSSDTSVIANDGTVTQPAGSDATVTLIASAVYGSGDPVTKTFTVTVPVKTDDAQVIDVAETDARTTPGVQPTLPAKVDVTMVGGVVTARDVTWDPIDESDLVAGHDFSISGTLDGLRSNTATANVYVRESPSSTITSVADAAVITAVGVRPTLPATVIATYDDGSESSDVPVTWDAVPSADLAPGGPYEVSGKVDGWSGTATAYIFVDDSAPGISSAGASITYGDAATITATLSGLSAAPTGTMTLSNGDTVLGTSSVDADGAAQFQLAANSLDIGTYDLTLTYDGSDVDAPITGIATLVVTDVQAVTPTISAPAVKAAYGSAATVKVTVSGGDTVPTGTVTVNNGDKVLGTATLASGKAKVVFNASALSIGSHTLTLGYDGDSTHTSATGSVSAVVTKAAAKVSAKVRGTVHAGRKRATLKVGVTATGVTPTGKVVIRVAGKKLHASLSHGTASVRLPAFHRPGRYRVTVQYAGNAHVRAASTTIRVTVRR